MNHFEQANEMQNSSSGLRRTEPDTYTSGSSTCRHVAFSHGAHGVGRGQRRSACGTCGSKEAIVRDTWARRRPSRLTRCS